MRTVIRHIAGLLLLICPLSAAMKTTGGGYIGAGGSTMANIGTNYTVALWMHAYTSNQFNNSPQAFVVRDNSGGTQTQIWFESNESGTGKLIAWCGGSIAITSNTAITDTAWHHIALRQDAANSWAIYIDGTQDATSSTNCTPNSTANNLVIGKHASNNKQCNACALAEVGIWSTALSAAEIAALAKGVAPDHIRHGNLLLYLPLHGRTTSGATSVERAIDLSGKLIAGSDFLTVFTSTGDVLTADHCPCSPPAGAESH